MVCIDEGKIIFDKGEIVRNRAALHLDQGVAITSHASQAKTVDQGYTHLILDIHSDELDAFNRTNQNYLELVVATIAKRWGFFYRD